VNLGIFETVFERASLAERFAAVAAAGFSSVQFHYASAGLESRPTVIPLGVIETVRWAADAAGIRIAAVSGTYNMVHPDPEMRAHGLASLEAVAASCEALGASIVTLCTGTRSTQSQWTFHPANKEADAWDDLVASMRSALEIADRHGLTFAIEPEPANVSRDATRARELLDTMDHPRLGIILDPANIIASDRSRPPADVLNEAFDLLGHRIVLAHAKDLGEGGEFRAAGTGVVPWKRYRSLLDGIGYNGDVIFHSLTEADVPLAATLLA
jgi:sugar phosphate isomerase/epimerase